MKQVIGNILLGVCAALSLFALLFQGFAFPSLNAATSLLLRLIAAICIQWLFLRLWKKRPIQAIPILVSAIAAVWGFFLYLTSPSWLGATFSGFISDYASFFFGCALVWAVSWLLPRIVPLVKKLLKTGKRRKKKKYK